MNQQQLDKLKNGDVIWANYPCDDPNDPNDYKPRNVLLLDKFSQSFYKVVCITDLENIVNEKGISVLANSDEANLMKLVKDSFINFNDCQTIPSSAVKFPKGKCPQDIFEKIIKANL